MGRTKPIVADEYVVGLTDGEGCFHVNLVKLPTYTSGVRVQMHFHIKMQEKDRPLLVKIKNTLQCGEVYFQKETRPRHCQCYRYTVYSQKDISTKIIPFFLKHPLQSVSKQESFKAFCKIGRLVDKQAHLTKKGIKQIQLLKSKMNRKLLGSRSAGNPLATWEREMFRKSHSPVKSRKPVIPEVRPRRIKVGSVTGAKS